MFCIDTDMERGVLMISSRSKVIISCLRVACFIVRYFLIDGRITRNGIDFFRWPSISRTPLRVRSIYTPWGRKRNQFSFMCIVFTARCYASAVLAMALCPSVCLSVCPSVTSRCSTKTAKRRITQITPHDTPGTLVYWCQRSPRNSTGVTPYEGAKRRWGGSKSATFDK